MSSGAGESTVGKARESTVGKALVWHAVALGSTLGTLSLTQKEPE